MSEQTSRMLFPFPARDNDPWYDGFNDFAQAIDSSTFASREDRSLIFGGGGTISVSISGLVATVTWTDTINISSPIGGFKLQIAANSENLNDGEILYTTLVRQPLINTSISVSVGNKLPGSNGDNTIVIAVRMGNYIYFRTGISLGDGDSSPGGICPLPFGSGPTDPNAIHKNTDGEILTITTKSTPVSGDYLLLEDSADGYSKKKFPYGNISDSNAIHKNISGEINSITLKGTPVSSDLLLIEDSADSNNKKRATIGSLPFLDSNAIHKNTAGEIASITLKGTPVSSDLLLIEDSADSNNKKRATISSLPVSDSNAIHKNISGEINSITLKGTPVSSDILLLEDSASTYDKKKFTFGSIPNKRTSSIIVGNSVVGDTISNCDYLDIGNGAQLANAIAAASSDADVYIRPGLYDFSAVGGPSSPITLDGIRVRGAGIKHTQIQTNKSGDCGAFILQNDATLEDINVLASEPTGLQIASDSIVLFGNGDSECKNVCIEFESSWSGATAGNINISYAFSVLGNSTSKMKILNCRTKNVPVDPTFPDFISYYIQEGNVVIDCCYSENGYLGLKAYLSNSKIVVTNCKFIGCINTAVIFDQVSMGMLSNCILKSIESGFNAIQIQDSSNVHIVSNYFEADTGLTGGTSIDINNGDYCVVSNNTSDGQFNTSFLSLDSSSSNNVVIGNISKGNSYLDSGLSNELAHNL